ncbi:MAG TPA: hypothetical protein VM345_17935 [Acidimicrobiales bacterium]|nr:hypothetical protein [Acidimicrobiales bacterium]
MAEVRQRQHRVAHIIGSVQLHGDGTTIEFGTGGTDRAKSDWIVTGLATFRSGRVVITELAVKPLTPTAERQGVNADVLRSVKVAEIVRDLRTKLRELPETIEDFHARMTAAGHPQERDPGEDARIAVVAEAARNARLRLGPGGYPDELWEWVARVHLELLDAGWTKGIHEELATRAYNELGHDIASQTARDWVRRARADGYLGPAKQGRVGATAGPKLRAVDRRVQRESAVGQWADQANKTESKRRNTK